LDYIRHLTSNIGGQNKLGLSFSVPTKCCDTFEPI
jgi:hypothetical protein